MMCGMAGWSGTGVVCVMAGGWGMPGELADLIAGILAEACYEYHRTEIASDGMAVNLTPFVARILELTRPAADAAVGQGDR